MANLMLTKQCNLHCPYCFANEFVNKSQDVMSYENFERAIAFLSSDLSERIGLIGGEPTLHPDFQKMLVRLINSPFQSVCVFTNGIVLEPYFNELRNGRFSLLINLNQPEKLGDSVFQRILSQIDVMVNHLHMREQIGLGFNLYQKDMDYGYILEALKRFRLPRLRVSVSVPNLEQHRNVDALDHFRDMMPTVRKLVRELVELNVAPNFDCNYIPPCLLTEDDRQFLQKHRAVLERGNVFQNSFCCAPVLDILPDLQVIRCFALSSYHRVNLLDYRNTAELRRHFLLEVEGTAYGLPPSEECRSCHEYLVGRCSCGCFAYRLGDMAKLRQTQRGIGAAAAENGGQLL